MTTVREGTTSVWSRLVGQRRAIEALSSAAGGHGMSHSFLFTGPPPRSSPTCTPAC
jgi:DNA polymerase III subunit delta'